MYAEGWPVLISFFLPYLTSEEGERTELRPRYNCEYSFFDLVSPSESFYAPFPVDKKDMVPPM
jgi:hypothetical protein